MKLIRLTTEDESALFDNIFNEDIIIKPNSRICLQTMTTQLNKDVLIINNQNNEIQFTLDGVASGDSNYYTINLTNGVYDSSNMEDFFIDFTDKLNNEMTGSTSATLGKQWLVALKGNRVEIQCKRGDVLTFNEAPIYDKYLRFNDNMQFNVLAGQNWVARDGGTDMTNDASFYSIQPMNKGASTLRCQLREDPTTNTGFILGYITSVPPDAVISITDIKYGIIYYEEGVNYDVIFNGAILPAGELEELIPGNIVGPANALNDILGIDFSENGRIAFNITQNGVLTPLYLDQSNIGPTNLELYAVGICVGDTQVFNFENTTDPYYLSDKIISYKKSKFIPNYGNPVATEPTPSETYFRIVDTDLAIFLGFSNTENLKKVASPTIYYTLLDNIDYVANTAFFLKLNIDSYIVELLNLKINSMDSMTNQHKNFLAVIPNTGTVVERVTYIAPVLLWIDLNNKEQINLRQLKARIIREDLTPLVTYGLSQLVILIE